jgi:hypothetical protein
MIVIDTSIVYNHEAKQGVECKNDHLNRYFDRLLKHSQDPGKTRRTIVSNRCLNPYHDCEV